MKLVRIFLAFTFCGFLSGCINIGLGGNPKANPTRFYLLGNELRTERSRSMRPKFVIGIQPVVLPAYLNRPHVVTMGDDNSLCSSEFFRWGEPLAAGIGKLFDGQLSEAFPDDLVIQAPWSDTGKVDIQLLVRIDDLVIRAGREIYLRGSIEFEGLGNGQFSKIQMFNRHLTLPATDEAGIVKGVEMMMIDFARSAVDTIRHYESENLSARERQELAAKLAQNPPLVQPIEREILAPDVQVQPPATIPNLRLRDELPSTEMARQTDHQRPEEMAQTADQNGRGANPTPAMADPVTVQNSGPRNIVLMADDSVYVTVENTQTLKRILSKRLAKNEHFILRIQEPVKIVPSNPVSLRVQDSSGRIIGIDDPNGTFLIAQ